MDLLFFSRGRGRGHAIPDIAIMKEVALARPKLEWSFASYSTGAKTFKYFGCPVHDLLLPEENALLPTILGAFDLVERHKPQFVIAHEEPAAVVAARLLRVPSVFITDWFLNERLPLMQPLSFVECVIFLEKQGVFDEPSYLTGRVRYVGPFVRTMSYSTDDRVRAREELGVNQEATVIACLPGGWATEARAPIADLLLSSFEQMRGHNKLLFWVAGSDFESLSEKTSANKDVIILEQLWPIERLMAASDLVVTKGNRGTIMEVAHLGVPSISLSHGLNDVEDSIVPRISSNLSLRIKGLTSEYLVSCIEQQINRPNSPTGTNTSTVTAGTIAAMLVAQFGL